jgi:glycosyltransferase involved in cell wall biosynthesis
MGSPRLFIIIPALNEEANIKRAILRYEVPAV